jgi:DNA-binding NarL/FixJ family response regulator
MVQSDRRISVIIADGQQLFRAGLRSLLEHEPRIRVAAEADTVDHAVDAVRRAKPDVLLLDLDLPGGGAAGPLERLTAAGGPHILVVATYIEKRQLLGLLRAGARGYVLRDSPPAMLAKAVQAVAAGECWLSTQGLVHTLDALRELARESVERRSLQHLLTHRELEIVGEVSEGATNRDVAKKLHLSEQTVKNHLSAIYDKLGLSTRLELALYAVEHHLTQPD